MSMTAIEGAIVIAGIALIVLGLIVVGRQAFKRLPEDAGVNADTELHPHPEGHVGRGLDPEQREEAVRATFPQDEGAERREAGDAVRR